MNEKDFSIPNVCINPCLLDSLSGKISVSIEMDNPS